MAIRARLPIDRFMEKVEVDPTTGCWLWTGAIHPLGYGRFWPGGPKGTPSMQAHDWAWEHWHGPIPAGLEPDHLCRVRRCVNALEHLELVTHRENTRRGHGFIGQQARQTHCIHGHPFDARNTYVAPNGRRECRRCNVRRMAEHRRRVSVAG